MIKIIFKNVGQGDSIILEWYSNSKKCIGIIDSNLYEGRNPILEYLIENSIKVIDILILSHFHYDHFSGMPEIFKHCLERKIKINFFIHTFATSVLAIYDRIFTTKKIEYASRDFFDYFDNIYEKNIGEIIIAESNTSPIQLSDDLSLTFLAPTGKVYHKIAKNLTRKSKDVNFSYADINKLSTIISIQNNDRYVLLTSDAVKRSFGFINKRLNKNLVAIQVPHHGSFKNINPKFWSLLIKPHNIPAIFSVGNEPKDKLPNRETVEFIDNNGFEIYSTNYVYGLSEHFKGPERTGINTKQAYLDIFSTKRNPVSGGVGVNNRFFGDKEFSVL